MFLEVSGKISDFNKFDNMKTLNIIGAGKCGLSLAILFNRSQQFRILAVCNANLSSAEQAVSEIGDGYAVSCIDKLPAADLIMIACPDDKIFGVANDLSKIVQPGTIVFHCSGVLNSTHLKVLTDKGCYVASVHPLTSFANVEQSITNFAGSYCGVEGHGQAIKLLKKIFTGVGAQVLDINTADKALYHTAAVFSSNYLVTLAHVAEEMFVDSGIEQEQAKHLVTSLMQASVTNLQVQKEIKQALTGPIQRGDSKTVAIHLANIKKEHIHDLYIKLGRETLKLAMLGDDKAHMLECFF